MRLAAMLASAPTTAINPLHISLFIISFCDTGGSKAPKALRHPSRAINREPFLGIHPLSMRRTAAVIVLALALAAPVRAFAAPAITVTGFTLSTASPDAG